MPAGDRERGDRRPGRPSLPITEIVAVAMLLVDEGGPDALTLRSLAARLGSSTATLYRHFPSRAALIDAVIDGVFGEVDLDAGDSSMPWPAALRALSTSLFETLERHRNVAPLLLEGIALGPSVVQIRERTLGVLLAGGFTPRAAVETYATVGRFVLGFGVQTRIDGRLSAPGASDLFPLDRFPATAAVASVPQITLAEEFEFGLAMLLLGLEREAAA